MSESNPHTHVVCAQCLSVVRVPHARLEQAPHCPQCHTTLFNGQPINLSAAGFEKHLQSSELPLVVDVWAPWCGPCQSMAPQFAEVARRLEPHWRFAKLNSDEEPQLASRLNIRSIPTVIVFHGGREVARQSGATDAHRLTQWLQAIRFEHAA